VPAYSIRLLSLFALLGMAGCAAPNYYAQAVSGHFELLRQREPIADLLAAPATDPALAARLLTAQAARRFALEELALPDSGSYTQFVRTGREAVTWNVIAAPEFSLEPRRWCFPVAGCVPYRGYFAREKAERFADARRRRGDDADVAPVLAYSTLGWFDDPLPDTMLSYDDAALAATLFHEMAHERLYVAGDAAFNESYAAFVEDRGLERWLLARGEAGRIEEWRRGRQASRAFASLLDGTRAELETLYAGDAAPDAMRAAKQAAFDRLREAYREKVREDWAGVDRFAAWFRGEPNNARLALARTYAGGRCAFERLFAEAGGDFERFHRRAEAKAALGSAARRAWLEQPCADIAPTGDL